MVTVSVASTNPVLNVVVFRVISMFITNIIIIMYSLMQAVALCMHFDCPSIIDDIPGVVQSTSCLILVSRKWTIGVLP